MKAVKEVSALLLVLIFSVMLAACGSAPSDGNTTRSQTAAAAKATVALPAEPSEKATQAAETKAGSGKTLVVFFSATGTTKGIAEQIAAATGADTYEILAAQPYTAEDLNWNDSNSRTTKEQNDKSVRPEIGSEKISLDGYDTVFIGFPIWWGEEPRIMDTFVESYDLSGKTMIPFCTSGGSGIGSSGDNLKANAGSGNWLEGARLSSSSDIEGWVNGYSL